MVRETLQVFVENPEATALAVVALGMAFSKQTRQKILERDGHKSVLSGATEKLHVAHIDHTRNERYDDPSNGRTLTVYEHLQDHVNREGRNGLTKAQNDFAIVALWKTLWGIKDD